jgi:hypothetical protein
MSMEGRRQRNPRYVMAVSNCQQLDTVNTLFYFSNLDVWTHLILWAASDSTLPIML